MSGSILLGSGSILLGSGSAREKDVELARWPLLGTDMQKELLPRWCEFLNSDLKFKRAVAVDVLKDCGVRTLSQFPKLQQFIANVDCSVIDVLNESLRDQAVRWCEKEAGAFKERVDPNRTMTSHTGRLIMRRLTYHHAYSSGAMLGKDRRDMKTGEWKRKRQIERQRWCAKSPTPPPRGARWKRFAAKGATVQASFWSLRMEYSSRGATGASPLDPPSRTARGSCVSTMRHSNSTVSPTAVGIGWAGAGVLRT
jgi:hypothetical protein